MNIFLKLWGKVSQYEIVMWGLQSTAQSLDSLFGQVYTNPLLFLFLSLSSLHEHLQTPLHLHCDTGRHSYLHTVR